jgi:DNA sulfur modification protein DndE
MNTPLVDVIRLGPATKIKLTTLKRRTGIENWNVLCRWAFCLSLADPEPLTIRHEDQGNAIEMTWKTFSGDSAEIYEILLYERETSDAVVFDKGSYTLLVRCHITRGLSRLLSTTEAGSIEGLFDLRVGQCP